MHVQIINFHLTGVSPAQYAALCDTLAPSFADVPGLVSKIWLADEPENTFGGVYLWRDRSAMEDFAGTPLYRSVVTHPNLANITSRDFAVMESPSRITRGVAETEAAPA